MVLSGENASIAGELFLSESSIEKHVDADLRQARPGRRGTTGLNSPGHRGLDVAAGRGLRPPVRPPGRVGPSSSPFSAPPFRLHPRRSWLLFCRPSRPAPTRQILGTSSAGGASASSAARSGGSSRIRARSNRDPMRYRQDQGLSHAGRLILPPTAGPGQAGRRPGSPRRGAAAAASRCREHQGAAATTASLGERSATRPRRRATTQCHCQGSSARMPSPAQAAAA